MGKDLFIIDTRCHLNKSIKKAFERKGYEVKVSISQLIVPVEEILILIQETEIIIFYSISFFSALGC